MQILNNSLLNILLPNDNKALKEVLKQADTKTLEQMVNNKSTSVNDVLKNLFDQVKNGEKTNLNIENLLKDSKIFKELGSFNKNINNLLKHLQSNSDNKNLMNFKNLIESTFKNIQDLDSNTLKEQISKSGVFLESKMAQNSLKTNPNLDKILNQVQNILKDFPPTQTKQINEVITKLQNPNLDIKEQISNLKSLFSNLQNISKSLNKNETLKLNNLTTQLQSIIRDASLVESKIENKLLSPNIKEQVNTQTKELLTQIKKEITTPTNQNQNTKALVSQIDNLIKSTDLFAKNSNLVEPKTILNSITNSSELKNLSSTNQNISNLVLNLKNIVENINTLENKTLNLQNISNEKVNLLDNIKETITSLKNELTNLKTVDTSNINQLLNKFDNIQNLFSKIEMPSNPLIQNQLANTNQNSFISNFSSNLNSLVLSLKENIVNNQVNLNTDSQAQNNVLKNLEKVEVILKEVMTNPTINKNENNLNNRLLKTFDSLATIKNELVNTKINDSQALNQIATKITNNLSNLIQTLQKIPNQNSILSSFISNLTTTFESLSDDLLKAENNPLNLQNQISKTIEKVEVLIKDVINNPSLLKNESNLSNDMKSTLLSLSQELAGKNDPNSQEILKQVDRLLTQIDYQQLNSIVSNSNYVYLPFFWDMLDEGTISMKKSDEEKFYCQINLSLKDNGKLDLMLALYDKNKLDLTIQAQREHFKNKLKDNLQKLKQALNNVDLIPLNIRLLDLKEGNEVINNKTNVYSNSINQDVSLGLDLRV